MRKRLIGRVFNDVVTWNNNRHYVNHRVFLGSIKFIFFNWLLLGTLLLGTTLVRYHGTLVAYRTMML